MVLLLKNPDEIKPGDRIVTEDGFTPYYLRVDRIERSGDHYTFHGWDSGERGELYFDAGETVEVAA